MKTFILVFILVLPLISYSQPSISWIQDTRGVSVSVDNSGNVYTADYEYNPAGDIYLTKRDSGGNFNWEVKYDQTDNSKWEKAVWVETDNLGNIIVTGNLMSGYSNPVNAASILMKFSPSGNLLWRNVFENSFDGSYTKKTIIDENNNIYVLGAGSSLQYGFTTKVTKFNPAGTVVWTYYNGGGIGVPLNFKFSRDNFIVIAGRSVFGSVNGYAKLDINGNPVWSISGISSISIGDIAGDSFGNSYIVHSGNAVNGNTAIQKIDPSGNQLWINYYNLAAQRIETGNDNLPVAAGYPNPGLSGSAFVKTDGSGNQLWLNPDADGVYNLLLHAQLRMDSQNNIYLAAGTLTEMAVCKVSANGNSAWVLTMPGSYATGFDIGHNNNVYVIGGKTAKILQDNLNSVILNLKALFQGLYDPISNKMVTDTARIYLRNIVSPYSVADSSMVMLDSNGIGVFNFSNSQNSVPYFIVVRYRNGVETWSAGGNSFTSGNLSYDFTTAASQAFGNNQILSGSKYCIFNGDVNQDGVIDGTDLSMIDNDALNSVSGYINTDLNGDEVIDISDIALNDNNVYKFVSKIIP